MSIHSNPVVRHAPLSAARNAGRYRLPLILRCANWLLEPARSRLWPIDSADLRRRAVDHTGLSAFDDLAPLDEPLEILCGSLNQEVDLSALGRLLIRKQLIQFMCWRLWLSELTARRPELFAEPIAAPLFVAGMPRSGTTFLHRTIARDPAWYSMPNWEAANPFPVAGASRVSGPDPRVRAGARVQRLLRRAFPGVYELHDDGNDEPAEEGILLAVGHASTNFGFGHFPTYTQWYTRTDHTGGYRLFQQFLQMMQANRSAGGRWLLKCPSHLEMLRPLLTVFNDAKVVLTHRDPISSIVSLAALDYFSFGSLIRRPNPHWFGRLSAEFMERALRSMVQYRDSEDGIANHERFVDVAFAELVGDPIGAVRRISLAAGHEPDGAAVAAMRAYAERPGGHSSNNRFTLEDFGLDEMELRERFTFYYERFDVPLEHGKAAGARS